MQVQEGLYGAHLNKHLDKGKRATQMQQMLHQLGNQRRQEELALWKDTSTLRERLFDLAKEYQDAKHRTGLMKSVEAGDAAYG